jgi:MoxR-like ATPase
LIRQEINKVWAPKGRDKQAPWFEPLERPPGLEAELRLILERSNRKDQDLLAAIFRRAILLHQRHETEGFLGAQRKILRRFSITIGNVYACAAASNGRETLYLLVDDDPTLRQTYEVGEAPFSKNELMWLHGRLDRDSLRSLLEDEAVWNAYGRMLRKVTDFSSARSNHNNRGKLSVLSGKPYEQGWERQKQVWLFQANPKHWDLEHKLQTVSPSDADDWTVTRYREEMSPGDTVVLWQGGPKAGVYAVGELVGEPFERELPPWRPPKNDGSETEWAISFRYERILQSPITRERLLENRELRSLQVLRAPQGTNFRVTEREWEVLNALLNGVSETPNPRKTLDDLADELLLEKPFLEKVIGLLRDKGQVIFYGPPGTGKTFVARKLIEYLAPEKNRREVVQFHPSYSYEDFVQGYRPAIRSDGTLNYDLKPGPFMRLATRAKTRPGEHVLLVDEINRGNLPKILGELLYLLEYREDEVALMYSEGDARFSLPEDLLIVGTMNTADRSIALIDAALRRRFHFVPFFPDEWPLRGLLLRWLERYRPGMVWVARIVDGLNALLRERFGPHLQVGPSHFMKKDLDEAVLRRVWDYDVMPFLEDQLFGQEEELERFRLERFQGSEDADHNTERAQTEPRTPDEE